ncbi:hypothetical protein EHQ50_13930 [Leptospira meyeri]|nr:hypothetical protein EHQ50_13930 [Leptospira meyeri]
MVAPNVKTKNKINDEIFIIDSIGTATPSKSLIGVYRANRAYEYTAKENIRLFLLDLENVR